MIWNREEYIAHMTFQDVGREMFTEQFGPLAMLEKEWRAAGVSEKEINMSAFGWDNVKNVSVTAFAHTGPVTGITPYVVSDNEHERITVDNMGRKCRLCKDSATIALPMEHPVQTMEDWLRVKHWYEFSESRINVEGLKRVKKLQQEGHLVIAWMPGGFDEPRQLLGEAELCIAFYEEPEMIEDMLSTIADTTLKVFERVHDYVTIDNLAVHEDMAGKSGPLVGPAQIREFINPYYRRIWDEVRLHGGIRRIGDGAFDSCFSLETVRFGGGVEVIGEGAFRDCSSLKTLSLPPSVTYLGAESFAGCSALKAVKLPSRIRELPEGVFRDCWALEAVELPPALRIIEADAFCGCLSLREIRLPNAVEAVGEGAFLGCDKLMRIEAPLHLEEAIGTPHPDCLVQLRGNA